MPDPLRSFTGFMVWAFLWGGLLYAVSFAFYL